MGCFFFIISCLKLKEICQLRMGDKISLKCSNFIILFYYINFFEKGALVNRIQVKYLLILVLIPNLHSPEAKVREPVFGIYIFNI